MPYATEFVLQLLLKYGKYRHDGHGAKIVSFSKKARSRLKKGVSHAYYVKAERYFDVYSVVANDTIITIGHRNRRFYN